MIASPLPILGRRKKDNRCVWQRNATNRYLIQSIYWKSTVSPTTTKERFTAALGNIEHRRCACNSCISCACQSTLFFFFVVRLIATVGFCTFAMAVHMNDSSNWPIGHRGQVMCIMQNRRCVNLHTAHGFTLDEQINEMANCRELFTLQTNIIFFPFVLCLLVFRKVTKQCAHQFQLRGSQCAELTHFGSIWLMQTW